MRRVHRKLIALFVYDLLGIPIPFRFKRKWMADWIVGSSHFEKERAEAERIVGLGRDT
jgi:hypothetical protein